MGAYIIAEAGVNHNGSLQLAHELIDVAADADCDAVKFQTFKAAQMVTVNAGKADYQKRSDGFVENQYDMLQKLELPYESHFELLSHAQSRGIDFLSTAFDLPSLAFLVRDLGLETIKISSGELTNHPFLYSHACFGVQLILSTGMSTLDEIQSALAVIALGYQFSEGFQCKPTVRAFRTAFESSRGQELLKEKVRLLHCTSEYPTRLMDVNLRAMQTLGNRFGVPVGYSDHTLGTKIAPMAISAGAVVLEKHMTTDKSLAGPDHAMSLSPTELCDYVQAAREAETVMGNGEKEPTPGELVNRKIGRKCLVAVSDIQPGERFTEHNVGLKRCDTRGLEPRWYWDLIGMESASCITSDSAIRESDIAFLQEAKTENLR